MRARALELFRYEGVEVRVTLAEDGTPRFVAADVAQVLGYAGGARPAIARVPERMKGVAFLNTPGGQQKLTVLTEAGVNRLIMRSKTEQAEQVQDWLAEVVMPSIARTGHYDASSPVPTQRQPDSFMVPRTLPEALRAYAAEVEAKEEERAGRHLAEARVAELTPAAEAWNTIASGSGTTDVGGAAKMLANAGIRIGPNALFRKLFEIGWTYRKGTKKRAYWVAYAQQVEVGRLTMKYQSRPDRDDEGEVIGRKDAPQQVRLTPKGLEDLLVILTRERFSQLELMPGGDVR